MVYQQVYHWYSQQVHHASSGPRAGQRLHTYKHTPAAENQLQPGATAQHKGYFFYLQELHACAVADYPPEAFLQRAAVLDNCLAVLASDTATHATKRFAFRFMHALVVRLKGALVASCDPEMLPVYSGARALFECMSKTHCLLTQGVVNLMHVFFVHAYIMTGLS